MDRQERKILEDQIDKGTLDVGINKIEETIDAEEKRLPAWKGVGPGIGAGLSLGILFTRSYSPLGLFSGDMVLALFGYMGVGAGVGALVMWLTSQGAKMRPPKDRI
jgi:hypothetical protein